MSAVELADLIDNWVDTLMLAEIVKNQFLRVCDAWDLHDWEVTDLPDGLRFQRRNRDGTAVEAVEVFDAGEAEPRGGNIHRYAVPGRRVILTPDQIGREREQRTCVN